MLKEQRLDIVIGSRYADGERTQGLSEWRQRVSRLGGQIARLVLKADLTDPMSGFFVMSRAAFDAEVHALSQRGFKILLDIFASAPRLLRYAEVPCRFNRRQSGESKLDTMVAWEFGVLVLDKLVGHFVPVSFVIFAAVGSTGVAVHLATLGSMAPVGFVVRGGAVGRRVRRDDLEFHPQQPDHLSRPTAARFGFLPWAASFTPSAPSVGWAISGSSTCCSEGTAGGWRDRGGADRRGVEFHHVQLVHLATREFLLGAPAAEEDANVQLNRDFWRSLQSPALLGDPIAQCLILIVVSSIVFVAFPGIDIWFSSFFYEPGRGFLVARVEGIRRPALPEERVILLRLKNSGPLIIISVMIETGRVIAGPPERIEVRPAAEIRGSPLT